MKPRRAVGSATQLRLETFVLLALFWPNCLADAQDLLPGAFSPAPVGSVGIGFNRTLSVGGRFASIGFGMPLMHGRVEGRVHGQFQEATRLGQGDLSGRIAVNLRGAPAMNLRQFASNRQSTILGVSLVVRAPNGQYDESQRINIGANRASFNPHNRRQCSGSVQRLLCRPAQRATVSAGLGGRAPRRSAKNALPSVTQPLLKPP